MARKNEIQIDGQMTFYDFCTETTNYVAQANVLVTSKQNLKLNSAKLIRSAIMQCVRDDDELKPYKVSINELAKMFGIKSSNLYQAIDDITDDIMRNPVYIRQLDTEGKTTDFIKMPWVQRCEYNHNLGLLIKLNDELKPLLLNLKEHYTQYTLENILTMKSVYSIRLYEMIMEQIKVRGGGVPIGGTDVTISVQQIRECCELENKYKQFGHLQDRVIKPSVEEINKMQTYTVTYDLVRYSHSVEDIIFHIETLSSKRGL